MGNWIADEVLYQARLSPRRKANTLSEVEVGALRKELGAVIRLAVEVNAEKEKFPRDWIFHNRWSKGKIEKNWAGHKIIFEKIAGRTTAWVPEIQK